MKISRLKNRKILQNISKICSSKITKVLLIIFFLIIHFILSIRILNYVGDATIRLVNIQTEITTEFMIELKHLEFVADQNYSSLLKEIFIIEEEVRSLKNIVFSTEIEVDMIENSINSIENDIEKIKDNYLYR